MITQAFMEFLSGIGDILSSILSYILYFFHWASEDTTSAGDIYVAMVRWVMPILAAGILLSVIWRMIRVHNPNEVWGDLYSEELGKFPIHHWECTIGRARHCDIIVKFATISRTQCALMRDEKGRWSVQDLSGRQTTVLNGNVVTGRSLVKPGSKLSIGGVEFTFHPITQQELIRQENRRAEISSPHPPWKSFTALAVFQFLTVLEFAAARPESFLKIAGCFLLFAAGMWAFILTAKALGQTGFEPEILAFFACTLDLAVTATSTPDTMFKQTVSILIGIGIFIFLGWYLRDLNRVVHTRRIMAIICVLLFVITTVFGGVQNGARNWIVLFGMSLQPSELAKICFIFAGAATLDRLFVKRNVFGFMILSGICLGALAVNGDFGTAAIFFVVFLVIAYMRSGDYTTLLMICGAVGGALLLVIRFRPYVASRFSAWRHVWEFADSTGYQQVRTMTASASGGMIGVGAGQGWLNKIAASNTDLVFGILCEEWGLIIALLAIVSILALALFAFRVVQTGRSSFYAIAACAASSLFVFQTILNVFGSVDILPLTGVTFPFVSCGGSSMIASWALLAYIKAADTRQNASFAVNHNVIVLKTPDNAVSRRIPNDLRRTAARTLPDEEPVNPNALQQEDWTQNPSAAPDRDRIPTGQKSIRPDPPDHRGTELDQHSSLSRLTELLFSRFPKKPASPDPQSSFEDSQDHEADKQERASSKRRADGPSQSTTSQTRVFRTKNETKPSPESIPDPFSPGSTLEDSLTEEDREMLKKNEKEIDDFLSQFDRTAIENDEQDEVFTQFLNVFDDRGQNNKGGNGR